MRLNIGDLVVWTRNDEVFEIDYVYCVKSDKCEIFVIKGIYFHQFKSFVCFYEDFDNVDQKDGYKVMVI